MIINNHHLKFGYLEDYITGEIIEDDHDERYRQKIARLLVEKKGYSKNDLEVRREILIRTGNKTAKIKLDIIISINKKIFMITYYGPGSITTRHRPAIALSRIITYYQVPVIVITNGENAEILFYVKNKIVKEGLISIPSRKELVELISNYNFKKISKKQVEMEQRVLYAFEVDGCCFLSD